MENSINNEIPIGILFKYAVLDKKKAEEEVSRLNIEIGKLKSYIDELEYNNIQSLKDAEVNIFDYKKLQEQNKKLSDTNKKLLTSLNQARSFRDQLFNRNYETLTFMKHIKINLQPNQRLYFTSDLHFGHERIIQLTERPWDNISDMNAGLIENWNKVVTSKDIIFHLGDLFWKNTPTNLDILKQLHGQIYILPGNHDYKNTCITCPDIVYLSVTADDWQERNWDLSEYEIWLCHYPLTTWPHRNKSRCLQLFGHIHSRPDIYEGFDQNLKLHPNQYDVGVDNNNYKPISLEEILHIIKLRCDPEAAKRQLESDREYFNLLLENVVNDPNL